MVLLVALQIATTRVKEVCTRVKAVPGERGARFCSYFGHGN